MQMSKSAKEKKGLLKNSHYIMFEVKGDSIKVLQFRKKENIKDFNSC